jgi:hypothetical protein
MRSALLIIPCLLTAGLVAAAPPQDSKPAKKKLFLIAGKKSHQYGEHAFRAGCILLKKRLDAAMGSQLETSVILDGWPAADPTVLDDADAICIYADGGTSHPVLKHVEQLDRLAKKGVGIGMMHYGVEIAKGPAGDKFLDWIGGYFEAHWSVNPTWRLRNAELAVNHPVTRGVKSYQTRDEWYYHMRFRNRMEGVTAILSDLPPDETLSRPDGPHSGNPAVREAVKRGEKQALAWVRERPDGGRGFGFTGGHFHWTWADDNNRKLVLNALVWLTKLDVPPDGVPSERPTIEELKLNQDFAAPKNFDHEAAVKKAVGR